jgi:hypothetical protein
MGWYEILPNNVSRAICAQSYILIESSLIFSKLKRLLTCSIVKYQVFSPDTGK